MAMSCSEQEYNWIDGVESLEKYRPGGYHPVMIGDVPHGRYRIVDKLGYGGYSTIWLAQDTRLEQCVAVKIGIAGVFPHETRPLRALSSSSVHPGCKFIPFPVDEFELHGPNGTHPCQVTQVAEGSLHEAKSNRLFPIQVARALVGKLILAVAFVHSRGMAHGGNGMSVYTSSHR